MVKGKKNYVWVGETHFDVYSPDMQSVLEECVSIYELCNPVEREDLFELGEDESDFIEFLDETIPSGCKAAYYDPDDNKIYCLYGLGNNDLTVTVVNDTITSATERSLDDIKATFDKIAVRLG